MNQKSKLQIVNDIYYLSELQKISEMIVAELRLTGRASEIFTNIKL